MPTITLRLDDDTAEALRQQAELEHHVLTIDPDEVAAWLAARSRAL